MSIIAAKKNSNISLYLHFKIVIMSELNDLVRQYQLSLTDLQTKCDDDHLLTLSQQISSFEDTAPYFDLTQPEINEICVDCRTERSRKLRMLLNWKMKNGSKATYLAIVNIFLRMNNQYLAEFVLRYCKNQFSSHFQEHSESSHSFQTISFCMHTIWANIV